MDELKNAVCGGCVFVLRATTLLRKQISGFDDISLKRLETMESWLVWGE